MLGLGLALAGLLPWARRAGKIAPNLSSSLGLAAEGQPAPNNSGLVRALANPSLCMAAEKVTSLGKDWHRPCLRCEKCNKTLTSGGHAEVGLVPGRHPWSRAGAASGVQGLIFSSLPAARWQALLQPPLLRCLVRTQR